MVGFSRLGGLEEQLGGLDHRVGLAAALVCQTRPRALVGSSARPTTAVHGGGLVLAQDDLLQLLVLLSKQDEVLQSKRRTCGIAQKLLTLASRLPISSCFQLKMLRRTVFQVTP